MSTSFRVFAKSQTARRSGKANRLRRRAESRSIPLEDQRQVGGLDLQAALIHTVGRELEGAHLQPLLPDRVTVPVPVQDFQAVPRLPPKNEPGSR